MNVTLREASGAATGDDFLKDAQFVLAVRNDPETRRMSVDSRVIPWEMHVSWYRRAVESPTQYLAIIRANTAEIGTVRLDQDEADSRRAEIHVALLPDFRGQGMGSLAIQSACERAVELGYDTVVARVKEINTASVRAFEKSGFRIVREELCGECRLLTLSWSASIEKKL